MKTILNIFQFLTLLLGLFFILSSVSSIYLIVQNETENDYIATAIFANSLMFLLGVIFVSLALRKKKKANLEKL